MFHPEKNRTRIALFASFFLAVSFWHINFSRIGFRAIMAPFFIVWGLYFFFKFYKDTGSPASQIISAAVGGLLFGLGFHSYIAYRAAPLLLLPLFISGWNKERRETCFPCLALIFVLFAAIAAMPLALYFLENPADFFGRTSEISIFNSPSPVNALAVNAAKTIGMFWFYGDANWRHNISGSPELNIAVGIFFFIGIILALKNLFTKFNGFFLLFWLAVMLAPVAISSEGLPHALRAIITIPPIMILSAYALNWVIEKLASWIHHKRKQFPDYERQLIRIRREIILFIALLFLAIAVDTYDKYFNHWAYEPETYAAFNARDWEMVKYLNKVSPDVEKYIVVTDKILDQRVITISSQSVMFGTDTFLPERRLEKKFHYVSPDGLEREIEKNPRQWAEILFLGAENTEFASSLLKKYHDMQFAFRGEFLVLTLSP
jgi:hypothetical protein